MDNKKRLFVKVKMLRVLNDYAGVEARQDQLVTDLQLSDLPHATPEDTATALQDLLDDGLCAKRKDTLRGWLWRIEPEGHRAAVALALEDNA